MENMKSFVIDIDNSLDARSFTPENMGLQGEVFENIKNLLNQHLQKVDMIDKTLLGWMFVRILRFSYLGKEV